MKVRVELLNELLENINQIYYAVGRVVPLNAMGIEDQEELYNEVVAYHMDLLGAYDPDIGSLYTYLVNTLPYALLKRRRGNTIDIPMEEVFISSNDIEDTELEVIRILHIDFYLLYFLNFNQRRLADLYYNQGYTVVAIGELLEMDRFTVRRDLLLVEKALSTRLLEHTNFFIYCCMDDFSPHSYEFFSDRQKNVASLLYTEGMQIKEVMETLEISIGSLYREIRKIKKLVSKNWKSMVDIRVKDIELEDLIDTLHDTIKGYVEGK